MADRPANPTPGKHQKGTSDKNKKLAARNKNVTSSFSDRNKEAKQEADVNREMQESETVFEPWQVRVIELQAAGWSFERIIKAGDERRRQTGKHRPRTKEIELPSRQTLYLATKARPEFYEECEKAYRFAIDSKAQETVELAESLDERRGLKPYEWVQARDKRIRHIHHVAGRLHPDKWGDLATSEREVIVFEPYGGWVPTNLASGSPGQGVEAEAAVLRWKRMRAEAKDV